MYSLIGKLKWHVGKVSIDGANTVRYPVVTLIV